RRFRGLALSMQLDDVAELTDRAIGVAQPHEHLAGGDAFRDGRLAEGRSGRGSAASQPRLDRAHRAFGLGLRLVVVESPGGQRGETSGEEDDRAHSPDRPNPHHFVPAPIETLPDAPARTAGPVVAGLAAAPAVGAAGPVKPAFVVSA